jgi:hypothetical protein
MQKAHKVFMKRENGLDLWVRGEPSKPFETIMKNRAFLKREKVVESLAPIHRHVIYLGLQYFGEIREEALFAAKLRWSVSSNEIKNKEPFGFRNFQTPALRLEWYSNMIMEAGPSWIGCKYSAPIIWYHPEGYQSVYELRKKHEETSFEELKGKHGFWRYREETSPPYSLIALHMNYLVA